jgi:transcriptional regulator with XRE-family HTH domain
MIKLKGPHSAIEKYVINQAKKKRLQKGYSQKKLAHLLNVSPGFIGNVENAKYRAKYNLNHINNLAIIFECSPGQFLPDDALL